MKSSVFFVAPCRCKQRLMSLCHVAWLSVQLSVCGWPPPLLSPQTPLYLKEFARFLHHSWHTYTRIMGLHTVEISALRDTVKWVKMAAKGKKWPICELFAPQLRVYQISPPYSTHINREVFWSTAQQSKVRHNAIKCSSFLSEWYHWGVLPCVTFSVTEITHCVGLDPSAAVVLKFWKKRWFGLFCCWRVCCLRL